MNLGSLQNNIKSINKHTHYFGYKILSPQNFKNNKVNRLVNLYQMQYRNSPAQGFGDYIRGCFFLLQVAMMNNLRFDMNLVNHPIGEFFEISQEQKEEKIDFKNVYRYMPNNLEKMHKEFYGEFCSHLNQIYSANYYLFCNSYPISAITTFQRRVILSKIKPNEELLSSIKEAETKLKLPESYRVLHIRSGDTFILKNKKIDSLTALNVYDQVKKFVLPNKYYLLLADNNELKIYLAKKMPNVNVLLNDITHLGESKNHSSLSVKNTLVDFFLMSKAKSIISFTVYPHGTSFSEWCAKLYNIPYYCEMLNAFKKTWFSV